MLVDGLMQRLQLGTRQFVAAQRRHQGAQRFLRMDRPAHAVQAAIQLGNLVVADAPVRQANVQSISGADLQAGDAHVAAKLTRQA